MPTYTYENVTLNVTISNCKYILIFNDNEDSTYEMAI